MKIGILYPRSNVHPAMMRDFMDGIKSLLQRQQLNDHIQLLPESIGFGGDEKEVFEKAEKLLVLDDADMLVAYVDLKVLEILNPLIYATGKLVLAVNPGANYPGNRVHQPNMLNLTLQHSFLCRLNGKLASKLKKVNAVMASSFYDCGYLHTAAIVNGFVLTGGKILFNYVNNQRYDNAFEIKQLTDYLSSNEETNILLCVFDSLPASLFYSRVNNFGKAGSLHLFVSPMMLEKEALEKIGAGFKFSIEGYAPWLPSLESSANKGFIDIYLQQKKRAATVFSLLGWETGLILQEIFLQGGDDFTNGNDIAGKLAKVKFNSPRGEMKLDPETNYFITPVYKCSIKQNSFNVIIDRVESPEKEWADFAVFQCEGVSSGWTNTYLCY
jgi:branched-chain amino acid transport system substrate-binding protein